MCIYSSGLRLAMQVERYRRLHVPKLWVAHPGFKGCSHFFAQAREGLEWNKLLRAVGHSALGPLQCIPASERHSVIHWISSRCELCSHGISSQRAHKKSLEIKACWYFLCSHLVAIIHHSLSTAVLEINSELVIFNLKDKISEALTMLQIHLHYKKTKIV